MTTSETESILNPDIKQLVAADEKEERKRRGLLLVLLLLLLLLCGVIFLFIRYAVQPAPLVEMLPAPVAQNIHYPPTYKFSVTGVNQPVGVGVSPDGQRVYVAESGGERLIKMFDRDGKLILTFAPPGTTPSNRRPVYIAVDERGRVFVADNYNHVIDVFSPDGKFIDAIISRDLTLSEFVASRNNGVVPAGTEYYYNNIDKQVYYRLPGAELESVEATEREPWTPLGLRFDSKGNLLVTDLTAGKHSVLIYSQEVLNGSWLNFAPQIKEFGTQGSEIGQLSFPNSVTSDSRGNFYVSDGNNGRISYWNADYQYETFFGFGSTENALNLPRGMWMDGKDRLHVADAVGQFIRVYDTSNSEQGFLYSFGKFGISDGEFNYPTDICIDISGRLYIADRENNRIQIWSY